MDYSIIEKYKSEIMKDLAELVSIPSVASEEEDGCPFGKEAARALDYILERAKELGFSVKNIGNAAGYAEMGEGEDYAAVLTHVDVVPAGDGWDTDPFTLTVRDGRLLGRGVADDKGAAVVALWCMKALADAGVVGKRRFRCVFGCGEEVGMGDMETFFAAEPLPSMAFTPDSAYPVCNREKGILHFSMSVSNDSEAVKSISAGTAVNCVAEKAQAELECSEKEIADIMEFVKERGCQFDLSMNCNRYVVGVYGKSAHAMEPESGVNAASALICALAEKLDGAGSFIKKAAKTVAADYDGIGMGIDCSDEPSGKLTFNLGNIREKDGKTVFGMDVRYPVTKLGSDIVAILEKTAADNGFELCVESDVAPIYMPEDDKLIRALCDCYEEITGEKAELYSTGGGTYARSLGGRGVAFGMEFPDSPPTLLHQANEGFGEDDMMRHAKICLAAMHRLFTMDD
ncbi:MAG: Sapep family Mn(2+)-dependent dipeptidase [Clostridia bacterium]|nr:Sapep family Mn(2+)-dependent dipeptidase [Clostridia bacterium]